MIVFIIIFFVFIILINLYFRIKVLGHYKYLVKHEIDFNIGDIFNDKKMKELAASKQVEHKDHILSFAKYLKIGVYLTCTIIIVIAVLFVWMKGQ